MAESVYRHVLNALENPSRDKEVALIELERIDDPLRQRILREIVLSRKRDLQARGIDGLEQYTAEGSARVRANLAVMDIAIAFPEKSFLPNTLDILRPDEIVPDDEEYISLRGNHMTNGHVSIAGSYRLPVLRVMEGTTDPDDAREFAQPEVMPRIPLVIGSKAVEAYAKSVQEWANTYPGSAARQKNDILHAASGYNLDSLKERPLPEVFLD